MTHEQRARRIAFWRGLAIALPCIAGYVWVLSTAGQITG